MTGTPGVYRFSGSGTEVERGWIKHPFPNVRRNRCPAEI